MIVGNGPDRAWLENTIREDPWIHYLGSRYGREGALCYRIADVFVLAGTAGLAVVDSFAAGLPLLATQLTTHPPEITYVIDGDNGLLAPHEPEAFAASITRVVTNPELMRKLKTGARKSGNTYTMEAMVHRFGEGVLGALSMGCVASVGAVQAGPPSREQVAGQSCPHTGNESMSPIYAEAPACTAALAERAHERRPGFRKDIQGLRAIAILMVLGYHAGLPGFGGGFAGVDVFFAISGYLIIGLLVREAEGPSGIDFARFYARRMRRLLPASLCMATCTLLAGWAILSPLELTRLAASATAASAYASNLWFLKQSTDYFNSAVGSNPLLHTWSLSVEEQFYLVCPGSDRSVHEEREDKARAHVSVPVCRRDLFRRQHMADAQFPIDCIFLASDQGMGVRVGWTGQHDAE